MAAGSFLGLPLSGALTARFGSRATTTVAIFAVLLATPLPILAPNLSIFTLALALLGIANGGVDVAMNAQAIAIEERLGRPIMSSFHGLFSAGGLVGAAGAALAMSVDVGSRAHLLVTGAGLFLVSVGAVAFLLPTAASSAAHSPIFRLPRGPLLGLGVLALCALLAEGAIGDWAAVYLRDYAGTSAELAALGFAAFSLAMTAGASSRGPGGTALWRTQGAQCGRRRCRCAPGRGTVRWRPMGNAARICRGRAGACQCGADPFQRRRQARRRAAQYRDRGGIRRPAIAGFFWARRLSASWPSASALEPGSASL